MSAKNIGDFVLVKDPKGDLVRAKRELLKMRFLRALGDSKLSVCNFKKIRRFVARCNAAIAKDSNGGR